MNIRQIKAIETANKNRIKRFVHRREMKAVYTYSPESKTALNTAMLDKQKGSNEVGGAFKGIPAY